MLVAVFLVAQKTRETQIVHRFRASKSGSTLGLTKPGALALTRKPEAKCFVAKYISFPEIEWDNAQLFIHNTVP